MQAQEATQGARVASAVTLSTAFWAFVQVAAIAGIQADALHASKERDALAEALDLVPDSEALAFSLQLENQTTHIIDFVDTDDMFLSLPALLEEDGQYEQAALVRRATNTVVATLRSDAVTELCNQLTL